jgi:hypothetical protein
MQWRYFMRRRTFDLLASAVGIGLTLTLIVAGALLMWGAVFTNNEVHSQLAAQKIVFPAKNSAALKGPEYALAQPYAGEKLLTGAQALAYANGKLLPDINRIAGGKTYYQLSSESLAQPKNTALAGLVATVFKGTTLRAELLEAYGFSVFGTIAFVASIVSFVLAALMLALSVVGVAHMRRVPVTAEVFAAHGGAPTLAH